MALVASKVLWVSTWPKKHLVYSPEKTHQFEDFHPLPFVMTNLNMCLTFFSSFT